MDNLQKPEHFISNTSDDDYVFVAENNSDEDANDEMEWIKVDFTENEHEEYNAQGYLPDKYVIHDDSADEMLPSQWEILKYHAGNVARKAVQIPVTIACVPLAIICLSVPATLFSSVHVYFYLIGGIGPEPEPRGKIIRQVYDVIVIFSVSFACFCILPFTPWGGNYPCKKNLERPD